MKARRIPRLNCAIYTRKSSEEGLEQSFNSLDAQRDACEAYILSQAGEGWRSIGTAYDDGGFSGGSLQRPALQQLLAEIQAGKVDVVVVYKVDRLTRSLADFAKIVEVFDAHGVSFVSVTQAFNTTTSMGRLTLNMLLSFAQFEREVTGERIRDKIAASKRKGMWMGGFVPLGYEARDRSLVINEVEAETVRTLFQLYLTHGSVRRVKEEADRLGLRSKLRPGTDGRMRGGRKLSRGYIYKLLGNPLYAGRIAHKDQVYDGLHEAIVAAATWEAVQVRLAANARARRLGSNAATPSLLAGLLRDDRGNRMSPSHAVKNGKRYRYYVNQALLQQKSGAAAVARLPAQEIEETILARIRALLADRSLMLNELTDGDPSAREIKTLVDHADDLRGRLAELGGAELRSMLLGIVSGITIGDVSIELRLSRRGLRAVLGGAGSPPASNRATHRQPVDTERSDTLALTVPCRLRPSSGELRLVVSPNLISEMPPRLNGPLIKAMRRGWAWKQRVFQSPGDSLQEIAEDEGLTKRYVSRLLRLAFLAPDIVEAVLSGRQPSDLDLQRLLGEFPLSWAEQRRLFGFPRRARSIDDIGAAESGVG